MTSGPSASGTIYRRRSWLRICKSAATPFSNGRRAPDPFRHGWGSRWPPLKRTCRLTLPHADVTIRNEDALLAIPRGDGGRSRHLPHLVLKGGVVLVAVRPLSTHSGRAPGPVSGPGQGVRDRSVRRALGRRPPQSQDSGPCSRAFDGQAATGRRADCRSSCRRVRPSFV